MNHLRARRLSAMALTVAITALCVAACGSSTGSSSASSTSASAAAGGTTGGSFNRTKFTTCLKAHGVTLPTRPARPAGAGAGGKSGAGAGAPGASSGFFGGGGGGPGRGFLNDPKLQAAFKACGGGNLSGGRRFGLNHAAVTKFVACVKQHGYDLPAPNFTGKGSVFPASIEKNKKFVAASKACASDLRPAGAGGPGTAAPSGSASSTTGA